MLTNQCIKCDKLIATTDPNLKYRTHTYCLERNYDKWCGMCESITPHCNRNQIAFCLIHGLCKHCDNDYARITCNDCDFGFCGRCFIVHECRTCDGCNDYKIDINKSCCKCGEQFCNDCIVKGYCPKCRVLKLCVCKKIKLFTKCDKCKTRICKDCSIGTYCKSCVLRCPLDKSVLIKHCKACNQLICYNCSSHDRLQRESRMECYDDVCDRCYKSCDSCKNEIDITECQYYVAIVCKSCLLFMGCKVCNVNCSLCKVLSVCLLCKCNKRCCNNCMINESCFKCDKRKCSRCGSVAYDDNNCVNCVNLYCYACRTNHRLINYCSKNQCAWTCTDKNHQLCQLYQIKPKINNFLLLIFCMKEMKIPRLIQYIIVLHMKN